MKIISQYLSTFVPGKHNENSLILCKLLNKICSFVKELNITTNHLKSMGLLSLFQPEIFVLIHIVSYI